ncbi:MAG: hypothetical protein AAF235_02480, partial [Planctomycetota bacterium]
AAWAVDRGLDPHDSAEAASTVTRYRKALALSNEERDRLTGILRDLSRLSQAWSSFGIAQRKRLLASPTCEDALRLVTVLFPIIGDDICTEAQALARTHGGIQPPPLVNGDDLVTLGIAEGPAIGNILTQIYDAQLEGACRSFDDAITLARELAASGGV